MAYTIVKTDGTVLTTVADGTINTTSTSLGLPGRNYAGYGQTIDTNMVRTLENFAAPTPPANPLRGQLWYNTNDQLLYVCPTDGESNALAWTSLAAASSGATTSFGNITVTGNATAVNINASNDISAANAISAMYLTISANATIANASMTGTTTVSNLVSTSITTGSANTSGTLTGVWTVSGSAGGPGADAFVFAKGGIAIDTEYGIKCDNYMYADGTPITFTGNYGNANVEALLPNYSGNVGLVGSATAFNGTILSTGANTTSGSITGNWSLTTGSRLNATYADLAERFEADAVYEPGTVVQIGGEKEITVVKDELSDEVFGVISNTAAYLMNAEAGNDYTHPPVAVTGRVSVKIVGKVKKGDRLVSAGNGIARAAKPGEATAFNSIGKSLQDRDTEEAGVIEAVVMIR